MRDVTTRSGYEPGTIVQMQRSHMPDRRVLLWAAAIIVAIVFVAIQHHQSQQAQQAEAKSDRREAHRASAELAQVKRESACIARAYSQGREMATAVNLCLEYGFGHQANAISLTGCLDGSVGGPSAVQISADDVGFYWGECAGPQGPEMEP